MSHQRRRVIFSIVMPLLISVGMILLIELALIIGGYGYPKDFLLKKVVNGREVFINNIFYTSKFFTPELIRTPTPLVINQVRKENTIRIVIAGESAALGDPDYTFGFARILRIMLEDAYPETSFEIINTSITAVNSHVILPIVKESMRKLKPDLLIIYMGNNEVIGPFGPNATFSAYTASRSFIKWNIAMNSTRIGTLARNTGRMLSGNKSPEQWDGMEMFLNYKVEPGDDQIVSIHRNFRENLAEMCQVAAKTSKVIVSTVAVNVMDCPPFYSVFAPDASDETRQKMNDLISQVLIKLCEGEYNGAKELAEQAIALDLNHADAHFLLGDAFMYLGNTDNARVQYNLALDLDGLKFRTDNTLNNIIEEVYSGFSQQGNVALLDVYQILADSSDFKIPGKDLFLEHVHFNFNGNYKLASVYRQKIIEILNLPAPIAEIRDVDYYKNRLAYTPFEDYKIQHEMLKRMDRSPFSGQLYNDVIKDRIEQQIAEIKTTVPRKETYQDAMAKSPDDWMIKYNYALYLMAQGIFSGEVMQLLQGIRMQVPQNPTIPFNIGYWHESNKDYAQAEKYYQAALDILPWYRDANKNLVSLKLVKDHSEIVTRVVFTDAEWVEMYVRAANISAAKGDMDKAGELFEKGFAINPFHKETLVALSSLYLQNKDYSRAIDILNNHLTLDSLNIDVYLKLAMAFEGSKDYGNAFRFYRQAMEIDESNPTLLSKIGQMSFLSGNFNEAITFYKKSIQIHPGQKLEFAYANIAMAYSKLDDSGNAILYFKKAISHAPKEKNIIAALANEYRKTGNEQEYNKLMAVAEQLPAQ
jgi:tetratricopeptide (TPR) repeat protein